MNVKYITDDSGKRSAVIVPLEEWKSIAAKINAFQEDMEILSAVKEQRFGIVSGFRDGRGESERPLMWVPGGKFPSAIWRPPLRS